MRLMLRAVCLDARISCTDGERVRAAIERGWCDDDAVRAQRGNCTAGALTTALGMAFVETLRISTQQLRTPSPKRGTLLRRSRKSSRRESSVDSIAPSPAGRRPCGVPRSTRSSQACDG